MNVMKLIRSTALLIMGVALAACGGGGGSGDDSGFNPPGIRVSASANSDQVTSGGTVDFSVRVTQASGAPVADGTRVSATITPAERGSIVAVTGSGPTTSASGTTVGGVVNFRMIGGVPGGATVGFSATDIGAGGRSVTANVGVTVVPAPVADRIDVTASASSVPSGQAIDVTVRVRNAQGAIAADGTPVTGAVTPGSAGTLQFMNGAVALDTQSGTTTAGIANFRFTGGPTGTATLTFATPNESGGSETESVSITITQGQPRITVSPSLASVSLGSVIDLTVQVRTATGAPAANGTQVSAVAVPASAGTIEGLNNGSPTGNNAAATTAGIATFRFSGRAAANQVVVTFSAPGESGSQLTTEARVNVTQGDARLTLDAVSDSLPINTFNVSPFLGSPYMSEVTVTVRDQNGQLVNREDGIQVSVNPVGSTGGFTTLDDGETEDVNEFTNRLGQGPVDVVAGKATVFMHSLNFSGETTMTITTQDATTGETVAVSQVFTIVSTVPRAPSDVSVSPALAPLYVQGSGGVTSAQFEVQVADGIGQPVPDPVAGSTSFNNVRLELVGDSLGARISGVNAAGLSVTGSDIVVRTTNGISGGALLSGTQSGTVVLRATADRADNNVDNGISDPVSGQRSIAISDGVPFAVQITGPVINAVRINSVDPTVIAPSTIPVAPDGTYSLTVSALVTDRNGNPALPGTIVQFGLVDDPVVGYPEFGAGFFPVSGIDGDPQEGGSNFSSLSADFADELFPVGPGDTLLTIGEEIPAIRDLEGARRVASVLTRTSLTVVEPFNLNDDGGTSINLGPVVPYVIGRAVDATIAASAPTNAIGVATTRLNYPISRLGKAVAVWARAQGAIVAGNQELATDVEFMAYPGVAPATLTASPQRIPGNATSAVTVCVEDLAQSPMPGLLVGFTMDGVSGTVDGVANSGVLATRTGLNGCTVAQVATTGVLDGSDGSITFRAADASDDVEVAAPDNVILQATPSSLRGDGTATITLRLLDGAGRPIADAQIDGDCEASGGGQLSFSQAPGATNAQGVTTARVTSFGFNFFGGEESPEGTCTFTSPGDGDEAEVVWRGIDLCSGNFGGGTSPPPPEFDCPVEGEDPEDENNSVLTVAVTAATGTQGAGSVTSAPAGITCSLAAGQPSSTCTAAFETGSSISLTARNAPGSSFVGFSGGCVLSGALNPAGPNVATVSLSGDQTCTAIFTSGTVTSNQSTLTLDVQPQIAGLSAAITSSPSGIFCNLGTTSNTETGTCSADFNTNSSVTLTAQPGAGTAVLGWSGTCIVSPTDPNSATVVLAGNQTCVVQLGASTGTGGGDASTLTVTLNSATGSLGNGVVTSAPAGIACSIARGAGGTTCTADFNTGISVRLTAVPNALDGSVFVGWTGACVAVAGQPTQADVVMSADRACAATFGEVGISQLQLTVNAVAVGSPLGPVSGSVTSAPAGISCGASAPIGTGDTVSCNAPFTAGDSVVLTATPGAGSEFRGWSGSCIGSAAPNENQTTILINVAKTCNANFGRAGSVVDEQELTLNLSDNNGDGASGGVITTSGEADCSLSSGSGTVSCSGGYLTGSTVQITATEGSNSRFVGFTGPCTVPDPVGAPNVAQIVMSEARSCDVRFANAGIITQSFTLTLELRSSPGAVNAPGEVGRVINTPAANEGVQCSIAEDGTSGALIVRTISCERTFAAGQTVVLQAFDGTDNAPIDGVGTFTAWEEACEPTAGDGRLANVQMTQNKTCRAVFNRD